MGDGSGRSRFAATYPEHQRNVAAYLANRRADASRADANEPVRGTATDAAAPATAPTGDAPAPALPAEKPLPTATPVPAR